MIYLFGHKNPDSDSICSSIALSKLKQKQSIKVKPYRLGEINKESRFILDRFEVKEPAYLEHVKTQIKDIDYNTVPACQMDDAISTVFNQMHQNGQRTMAICEKDGTLVGLTTMHDIAMTSMTGDIYQLDTSLELLQEILGAEPLNECASTYKGSIMIGAYYLINKPSILDSMNEDTIIIVGDRYDVIKACIDRKVQLILVSGYHDVPKSLIKRANKNKVSLMKCPHDTYALSRTLTKCNRIASIATTKNIESFVEEALIEVVLEETRRSQFAYYPIVDKHYKYKGLIGRRHLLFAKGKDVILVDHNEESQSAEGILEANIIGIVDHHKIGNLATHDPIEFRNEPVGSTCTIVAKMYKENNIELSQKMAAVLLSGIISDTLCFNSPTTTQIDKVIARELHENYLLDEITDLRDFAMEMFKHGTAIDPGEEIADLLKVDLKVFEVSGQSFVISQIYTVDLESIEERKAEIGEALKNLFDQSSHMLAMLVVTDIINQGSYIYYYPDKEVAMSVTYGDNVHQGMYLPGVVSRKKQIVPNMMQRLAALLTGI